MNSKNFEWLCGNVYSYTNEKNKTKVKEKLPGISSEELTSGWLCYSLNGSSADDPVSFFQTLGEDLYPVLNSTHARVYYINNVYTNVPEGGNGLTQPTLVGTEVEAIYGTDGKRRTRLMPGVNIVRMTDGTSRKLYVKP